MGKVGRDIHAHVIHSYIYVQCGTRFCSTNLYVSNHYNLYGWSLIGSFFFCLAYEKRKFACGVRLPSRTKVHWTRTTWYIVVSFDNSFVWHCPIWEIYHRQSNDEQMAFLRATDDIEAVDLKSDAILFGCLFFVFFLVLVLKISGFLGIV